MELGVLPTSNLKQILNYLNSQDKYIITLTCKEWYQVFLSLIIEMEGYTRYTNNQCDNKMLRYNKCITYMDISYIDNFCLKSYPYLIKLTIDAELYFINFDQLSHLDLVGIIFTKYKFIGKYLINTQNKSLYKIDKKLLYRKLDKIRYLNIKNPSDIFFKLVLPFISNNIKYLDLASNSKSLCLYSTVFNKMNNVVQLKVRINQSNFKNLKDIESIQSSHLKYLIVDSTCSRKIDSLKVNFNHLPNLQQLTLNQMNNVEFIGISNLKYLELYKTRLKYNTLNNEQFLKLTNLSISHSYSYSFQLLYSIFRLSNLIYLTLKSNSAITIDYLMLNEIYSNKINNLIKINLDGFNMNHAFLYFLHNSCKNLQQLFISHCYFYPLYSPLLLSHSKLTAYDSYYHLNKIEQIQLSSYHSYEDNDIINLDKLAEILLLSAPNLKYYNNNINLPKFKDPSAILKFNLVSNSSYYYAF
ncbi:hypothetical protein K502DRAFT_253089 [Neoconidiobolus thromboides FSU 785]|nr:hypothetical protein K502DRAFT_253089 [Neoconidiobolus thromboides FSU 785]